MKHELNTDGKKMEWWSIGVMGRLADVGKGGQKAGKWRSFSHLETGLTRLFPRFSTQVVDFPLLSRLRVERGGSQWAVDNWQWIANRGNESNRTNGTNLARSACKAHGRESARKCGLFHEVTRSFTKVRIDQGRGYAMLRIFTGERLFFNK